MSGVLTLCQVKQLAEDYGANKLDSHSYDKIYNEMRQWILPDWYSRVPFTVSLTTHDHPCSLLLQHDILITSWRRYKENENGVYDQFIQSKLKEFEKRT